MAKTYEEVVGTIAEKAEADPEYKKRLETNPREVLAEELGADLPEKLKVHFLQQSPDELHIVIPANSSDLTDDELEMVSGGTWLKEQWVGFWDPIGFIHADIKGEDVLKKRK